MDAYEWVSEGKELARLNKHSEAIECYEKAIKIGPKSSDEWVEAWEKKAESHTELKLYQDAILCYDVLIDSKSASLSDLWIKKATCYFHLELNNLALSCCDKSLEISAKSSFAWYLKGHILNEMQDHANALKIGRAHV